MPQAGLQTALPMLHPSFAPTGQACYWPGVRRQAGDPGLENATPLAFKRKGFKRLLAGVC